jgi:hypothetical protein
MQELMCDASNFLGLISDVQVIPLRAHPHVLPPFLLLPGSRCRFSSTRMLTMERVMTAARGAFSGQRWSLVGMLATFGKNLALGMPFI